MHTQMAGCRWDRMVVKLLGHCSPHMCRFNLPSSTPIIDVIMTTLFMCDEHRYGRNMANLVSLGSPNSVRYSTSTLPEPILELNCWSCFNHID